MIRDEKYLKKLLKQQQRKEKIFKRQHLPKMEKAIAKILFDIEAIMHQPQEKIRVKAYDFKSLSLDEVRYGFELLKKQGQILAFEEDTAINSDAFILTLNNENRSECRILDRLVLSETTIESDNSQKAKKLAKKITKQNDQQPIAGQIELSAEPADDKSDDEPLDF